MDAGLVYGCLAPHPPILVPALGGHRLEQIRQTRDAMQLVASDIERLSPDTLVLISPHAPANPYSMSVAVAERYVGGFDSFGVSAVRLAARGDAELASAIQSECRALAVPVGRIGKAGATHHLDHGASVPLYFVQRAGARCELVLVAFSSLGVEAHSRFGRAIARAARAAKRRAVLMASGDLSHRLLPGAPAGFSPQGRRFDETVVAALRSREFASLLELDEDLLEDAGECGYRSLVIALGALPGAEPEVLSYEGPFGVGYLVARFLVGVQRSPEEGLDSQATTPAPGLAPDEREALRLARSAVESHIGEGELVAAPPDPEGLLAGRSGVFVSLKIEGQLRGCIGTFQATEPNIAAEIIRNAISAATKDPRFLPVLREELPRLQYSVDVLSRPEPVEELSQLDPTRYGVIVQAGVRRGLLLPDLEGISTAEDQVEIARRKAGIPRGSAVKLFRFTVRRIKERG